MFRNLYDKLIEKFKKKGFYENFPYILLFTWLFVVYVSVIRYIMVRIIQAITVKIVYYHFNLMLCFTLLDIWLKNKFWIHFMKVIYIYILNSLKKNEILKSTTFKIDWNRTENRSKNYTMYLMQMQNNMHNRKLRTFKTDKIIIKSDIINTNTETKLISFF